MKWSWKLGEFRGIGVYRHATFLILIGSVVLSHWSAGRSLGETREGVGFVLGLFICIVLPGPELRARATVFGNTSDHLEPQHES